jgi:tetratricopeptide (TPR) repeat protein
MVEFTPETGRMGFCKIAGKIPKSDFKSAYWTGNAICIVTFIFALVLNAPLLSRNIRNIYDLEMGMSIAQPFSFCFNRPAASYEQFITNSGDSCSNSDYRNCGLWRLGFGRWWVARSYLVKAVNLNPNDPVAHLGLAKALNEAGEIQAAAQQMRETGYHDIAEKLVESGYQCRFRKGATSAYPCMALAAAVEPGNAIARAAHGDILIGIGNFQYALQELNLAIILDPNFGRAYLFRAHAKLALHASSEDIHRDFQRARTLAPHDFDVRYGWANWLASIGKKSEAIDEYEQLLRMFPSVREPERALAVLKKNF